MLAMLGVRLIAGDGMAPGAAVEGRSGDAGAGGSCSVSSTTGAGGSCSVLPTTGAVIGAEVDEGIGLTGR